MNLTHLAEKFELNHLEKQIVAYMQEHIHDLKSIGIRQMAKDNYTSTSTIYKLCNKFGFDGYSDMIYHLTSTKDITIDFNQKYLEYKETFSSLLSKTQKVVVFGLGFSASIAEYIHQRLTLLGYQSLCVVHMEMFNQMYQEDTLFIVISYSGQTPRLNEIVHTASDNHIPVISFIANTQSPIYKDSTLSILIDHYDSFSHEINKPNLFYGETLIAFETLLFS